MRSEDSSNSKTVRIGPNKYKLCLLKLACTSLGLTLLPISKYAKCVIKPTQHTQPSETKLHLNGHETILLIPFRKDQKLISRLQPSRPLAFYLGVVYFTFPYFTTYLNNEVMYIV